MDAALLQIRRLKEHVLVQLPPKRRQLIRLQLKRSDIASAKEAISFCNADKNATKDITTEELEKNLGNLLCYASIACVNIQCCNAILHVGFHLLVIVTVSEMLLSFFFSR